MLNPITSSQKVRSQNDWQILVVVVTTLAVTFLGCVSVRGQLNAKQLRSLADKDFEICVSDYMFVDSPNGGSRTLLLTIFVRPEVATKARLSAFSNRIKIATRAEDSVAAFFIANRNIAKHPDDSDDDLSMKSLRGFYMRRSRPQKEIFRYFSSGVRHADLESLAPSTMLEN